MVKSSVLCSSIDKEREELVRLHGGGGVEVIKSRDRIPWEVAWICEEKSHICVSGRTHKDKIDEVVGEIIILALFLNFMNVYSE